jgi:hypothetical protein
MKHNFMVEVRNVLNGEHDVRIVRIDRMKAAFTPDTPARANHGLPLASRGVTHFLRIASITALGRFLLSLSVRSSGTCGESVLRTPVAMRAGPRRLMVQIIGAKSCGFENASGITF